MKVFSRIVTMAAIASAAVVSHAPTVRAQPLPSASDVIAKYVTAIGGKEAILQIKSDPHSPEEIRGQVPERNLAAFHEAFGLKPGDRMYLEPGKRVTLW